VRSPYFFPSEFADCPHANKRLNEASLVMGLSEEATCEAKGILEYAIRFDGLVSGQRGKV
jgi:hypothetical protein